jgi:transposase
MDISHDGMSVAIPDSVNGNMSDDILNESVLVQLQSVANSAEVTHSLLANNLDGATLQHSDAASASSARPSPSQVQNSKEVVDSIAVSQQDAVRALRKYTTLTNTEIFRRVGVSSSGGYRYLRGEDIRDKETRGRKRKLDDTVINKIIHEIESQPVGEKTRSWEELCKLAGVEGVAPITLKRAVESAGYYKCSHCQRGMHP